MLKAPLTVTMLTIGNLARKNEFLNGYGR